jgi:transketolase
MPNLALVRPADANETAAAWRAAVNHDGPTALVLTRQAVRVCTDGSAVEAGAGVVRDPDDGSPPDVVLLGTGSEVAVCVDACDILQSHGIRARVVSMPSWGRFAERSAGERDRVLPPGIPVVSVEAAATFGWDRWADASIGIDRFGTSAPGDVALSELGITPEHVVEVARTLIGR